MIERIEIHKSDRWFAMWGALVSHSQLLIRSPKGPASPSEPERLTNIGLVFDGVDYLNLPTSLKGLELLEPSQEEIANVESLIGPVDNHKWIRILASQGHRFVIVAAHCSIYENDWGWFESPLETQHTHRDPFAGLKDETNR